MIRAMSTRQSVAIELAAIGAAALIFVATFRVRPAYVDFALAGVAVALIAASARRSRRLWDAAAPAPRAGADRDAWLVSGAFTAAALVVLVALAAWNAPRNGTTLLARVSNWHVVAAMALYFSWALLQQYIFQRYLLGRLLQLLPPAAAVAVTALAFSSVHFPRWPVMALVVIACSVWSTIYYRSRALLPLAASHALLGAVLHYWVFGNDLLRAWLP
jgi:membrane protease YdiL (CAAX protease family)